MGIVEDDAERLAVAGAHPAHAMAQIDAMSAARSLHRALDPGARWAPGSTVPP